MAKAIAANLKAPLAELPERVAQLQDERKKLERELGEAKKKLALRRRRRTRRRGPSKSAGVALLARVLEGVPAKDLRGAGR